MFELALVFLVTLFTTMAVKFWRNYCWGTNISKKMDLTIHIVETIIMSAVFYAIFHFLV